MPLTDSLTGFSSIPHSRKPVHLRTEGRGIEGIEGIGRGAGVGVEGGLAIGCSGLGGGVAGGGPPDGGPPGGGGGTITAGG